jgi:hemerythrin
MAAVSHFLPVVAMPFDIPVLPVAFMNDDHALAASQLDTMQSALALYGSDRAPLANACREFLQHSREHFAREEAMMQETGFPPFAIHKSEHDRVLAWLEALTQAIEAGSDTSAVSAAVMHDIPDWFVRHIRSMDNATAAWAAAHPG